MKRLFSPLLRRMAFAFVTGTVSFLAACGGPATEETGVTAQTETLAPLPDSLAAAISNIVRTLATNSKCVMALKVGVPGQSVQYIGFDGRDSTAVEDFSIPYEIGSTTKMFTATAILQLMEAGQLSLETPLVEVLPEENLYDGMLVIDGVDYIDSVKVLNLVNHTSGLPDYFIQGSNDDEIAANGDASLRFSFSDLMGLSKQSKKDRFKPDSKFEYSNINYILLGQIIEKVSGQSYTDYVQAHILDPLGMKNTYFGTRNPPAVMRHGHFKGKEVEMPYTMAGPAGEIISTLDDMYRFIDGWYAGALFEKEATRNMVMQDYYHDMGLGLNYGLGVINYKDMSWGHAGETFGFQAYSAAIPNGYRFTMFIDDSSAESVWLPAMALSGLLNGEAPQYPVGTGK